MKKNILTVFCALFFCGSHAQADTAKEIGALKGQKQTAQRVCCDALGTCSAVDTNEEAIKAATVWIGLIDQKDYRQGWIASSELLQRRYKFCKWIKKLHRSRYCLGIVGKRELVDCTPCSKIKKLPRGCYITLQYQTGFGCGKCGCERIILRYESEGCCEPRWRVVCYDIKILKK